MENKTSKKGFFRGIKGFFLGIPSDFKKEWSASPPFAVLMLMGFSFGGLAFFMVGTEVLMEVAESIRRCFLK